MDKILRNDPCPCGSGKKYKKCCQDKKRQLVATKVEATSSTTAISQLFQSRIPQQPDASSQEEK